MVGAPATPVSAVVCLEDVLEPTVLARPGRPAGKQSPARLARKTPSRPGMEEIVRLAVGKVGGGFVAAPLARGAGLITSLTKAQAITRIPAQSEGLAQDDHRGRAAGAPGRTGERVENIGSHDNILDLLANELMGLAEPLSPLVSSHVGSMGGLDRPQERRGACGLPPVRPRHRRLQLPARQAPAGPGPHGHQPGHTPTGAHGAARQSQKHHRRGRPRARGRHLHQPPARSAAREPLLDPPPGHSGHCPTACAATTARSTRTWPWPWNVLTHAADCGLGILPRPRPADGALALERYDLILPTAYLDDPRIKTLRAVIDTGQFQERMRAPAWLRHPAYRENCEAGALAGRVERRCGRAGAGASDVHKQRARTPRWGRAVAAPTRVRDALESRRAAWRQSKSGPQDQPDPESVMSFLTGNPAKGDQQEQQSAKTPAAPRAARRFCLPLPPARAALRPAALPKGHTETQPCSDAAADVRQFCKLIQHLGAYSAKCRASSRDS